MIPYGIRVDNDGVNGYAVVFNGASPNEHLYAPVASPTYVDAGDLASLNASKSYTDASVATLTGTLVEIAQDAIGAALVDSTSIDFTYTDAANQITAVVLPAGVNHNSLANLAVGDVHPQYLLSAGRAGGQFLNGGTGPGENLTLNSTADPTKGKILFGLQSAYDGAKGFFGVGTQAPLAQLHLSGGVIAASWGLNGIGFRSHAGNPTFTDTSAAGTIASMAINVLGSSTINASNGGVTFTDAATVYIGGGPSAGTAGVANSWGLWNAGATRLDGRLLLSSAVPAVANYGLLSLGAGPFNGSTAGFFTGNAAGTMLAGNAAAGYTGDLLALQIAGAPRVRVDLRGTTRLYANAGSDGYLGLAENFTAGTMVPYVIARSEYDQKGIQFEVQRATNQVALTGHNLGSFFFKTNWTATTGILVEFDNNAEHRFWINNRGASVVRNDSADTGDIVQFQKSDGTIFTSVSNLGQIRTASNGSTANDLTQYSLLIQPSGVLAANWGPLAIALTSGASSPSIWITKKGYGFIRTVAAVSDGYTSWQSNTTTDHTPLLEFKSENSSYGAYFWVTRATNQAALTGHGQGSFVFSTSGWTATSGTLFLLQNGTENRISILNRGPVTIRNDSVDTGDVLTLTKGVDNSSLYRFANTGAFGALLRIGAGTLTPGNALHVVDSAYVLRAGNNVGLQNATTGNSGWANFGTADASTPIQVWFNSTPTEVARCGATGQWVYKFLGSASNNLTKYCNLIQPSGALAANYAAIGICTASGDTVAAFEIAKDGRLQWGAGGSSALDTNLYRGAANRLDTDGSLRLAVAGSGVLIKEGSNATMGVATLVGGTVVVNTAKVTASSRIYLTGQNASGAAGALGVTARVVGTSFTITSLSGTDTRDVAWLIVEPA